MACKYELTISGHSVKNLFRFQISSNNFALPLIFFLYSRAAHVISQINQSHQIIFFIIFQIQVTDTIKITTQKQGGLANNNRAIAVVRIFTKINITIVRKTILIIFKKKYI